MSQPIPNDMEGVSPTEQARSSTSTRNASDLEGCKRSPNYWFEDGSIVLRVEAVLFRVHRSILSRHSSVFRDMFAMPQPATSNKELVIEGCDVVELPGDKAEDWENLFKILYDVTVQGRPNERILVSIIRLGRKYQFDQLFDEAMSHIVAIFPQTLDTWTGIPDEVSKGGTLVFEILFVLLEIGNQTLLPMLYFYCASLFSMREIFEVFRAQLRDNETRLATLETILSGKAQISSLLTKQKLEWASLHSDCQPRDSCSNIMSSGLSLCHQTICNACRFEEFSPSSVLQDESLIIDLLIRNGTLCDHCKEFVTEAHEEERFALWADLPSYFGLPNWQSLKDV